MPPHTGRRLDGFTMYSLTFYMSVGFQNFWSTDSLKVTTKGSENRPFAPKGKGSSSFPAIFQVPVVSFGEGILQ